MDELQSVHEAVFLRLAAQHHDNKEVGVGLFAQLAGVLVGADQTPPCWLGDARLDPLDHPLPVLPADQFVRVGPVVLTVVVLREDVVMGLEQV